MLASQCRHLGQVTAKLRGPGSHIRASLNLPDPGAPCRSTSIVFANHHLWLHFALLLFTLPLPLLIRKLCDAKVMLDEAGTVTYVCIDESLPAPTVDEILQGLGPNNSMPVLNGAIHVPEAFQLFSDGLCDAPKEAADCAIWSVAQDTQKDPGIAARPRKSLGPPTPPSSAACMTSRLLKTFGWLAFAGRRFKLAIL